MQTPEGGDPMHPDVPWDGEEWPEGTPTQCLKCGWSREKLDLGSPDDDHDDYDEERT
jgi:hypothetical protein